VNERDGGDPPVADVADREEGHLEPDSMAPEIPRRHDGIARAVQHADDADARADREELDDRDLDVRVSLPQMLDGLADVGPPHVRWSRGVGPAQVVAESQRELRVVAAVERVDRSLDSRRGVGPRAVSTLCDGDLRRSTRDVSFTIRPS
jgi:hypothetical protein